MDFKGTDGLPVICSVTFNGLSVGNHKRIWFEAQV